MGCDGWWVDGILRSNKIMDLLMKLGKSFLLAKDLSRKVHDLEQLAEST